EQARRAREIADVLRTKVESTPDDVMEAAVPRSRRKGGAGKTILVGLVALVAFAIGFLHMVPLRPFAAKVEKAMGEWMKDDVSVGSAKLRLLPSPHIAVADVAIGKAHDAKAASGIVSVSIGSLFGDKPQVTA